MSLSELGLCKMIKMRREFVFIAPSDLQQKLSNGVDNEKNWIILSSPEGCNDERAAVHAVAELNSGPIVSSFYEMVFSQRCIK